MFARNLFYALFLTALAPTQVLVAQVTKTPPKTPLEIELAKFDEAEKWKVNPGAGGTEWDPQYRSFIQTDSAAKSKGMPTHAESAELILIDAKRSRENLLKHKNWVLHIKWGSEAYRPAVATADLKKLYTDLVKMELADTTKRRPDVEPAMPPAATRPGTAPPAAGLGAPPVTRPGTPPATRPVTPPVTRPGADRPQPQPPRFPFENDARVNVVRDAVYGRVNFAVQRMDAYLVKSDKPAPVLVEFHGGGWRNGSRNMFDTYPGDLISKVIDAGISVISVEYRMTPDYIMPAMTDDAARAVQFIRTKAKDWNIDPKRIVAIGGSAGAHLAAWVALHDDLADKDSKDPVDRESSRLSGFVDLWGPMDLTRPNPKVMGTMNLRGEDFALAFTAVCGCSADMYNTDPTAIKRLREASPLFLVTKDDPPALIVHQGPVVTDKNHPAIPAMINDPHSWQQGVLLADAMDDVGIKVIRHISPTAGKDPAKDVPLILEFLKARFKL